MVVDCCRSSQGSAARRWSRLRLARLARHQHGAPSDAVIPGRWRRPSQSVEERVYRREDHGKVLAGNVGANVTVTGQLLRAKFVGRWLESLLCRGCAWQETRAAPSWHGRTSKTSTSALAG